MFADACQSIMKSLYAVAAMSHLENNQTNVALGSAFSVAPGLLVTAAHLLHCKKKEGHTRHEVFYALRARTTGMMTSETPTIVAEDLVRDIALLRVSTPPPAPSVKLEIAEVAIGTPCGFLGFPLARMVTIEKPEFRVRFQAAHVSAFTMVTDQTGRTLPFYEVDRYMYQGSSGCPSFLVSGKVFGMHAKSVHDPSSQSVSKRPEDTPRVAVSLSVPAKDILSFLASNEISL